MATPETGHFRLPPQLDVNSGNVSENFKRWKRQVEVYLAASGATAKDKKIQTAIILNCAGPHVLEVYDNFTWESEGDEDKPEKVFEALERYCNPRANEVFESHRFWNVPYQEPFDKFFTDLQTRAASCNFQEKDRMLRGKIVFTVTGKLQELLLREDGLTLEKALKICRAFEQSNKHVKELRSNFASNALNSSAEVNKISRRPSQKANDQQNSTDEDRTSNQGMSTLQFDCKYCGYKHERKREKCPAWGKKCDKCKGPNHFKSKCKKNVHAISQSGNLDDDIDDKWLMAVKNDGNSIIATLTVNDLDVKFQLDSAADVNTICQKHVREQQVSPTNTRLNMWNKTDLKPLGETSLVVTNPCSNIQHEIKFVVVPNGFTNLLGLNTIQQLGFVTINNDSYL